MVKACCKERGELKDKYARFNLFACSSPSLALHFFFGPKVGLPIGVGPTTHNPQNWGRQTLTPSLWLT
jgi:hypothetical protein